MFVFTKDDVDEHSVLRIKNGKCLSMPMVVLGLVRQSFGMPVF